MKEKDNSWIFILLAGIFFIGVYILNLGSDLGTIKGLLWAIFWILLGLLVKK